MSSENFVSLNEKYPNPQDYAQAMNAVCKEIGKRTIAYHLSLGNPVYYVDPEFPDYMVKENPDGSRYIITPLPERKELVIRKI